MVYREFLPISTLRDYVEAFWSLKSQPEAVIDYRSIFPDACADIIFNFGAPLQSSDNDEEFVNSMKCFLVGTMTRPMMSKPTDGCDLLGVRFKPGDLFSFLNIPLGEITDKRIDMESCSSHKNLYERIVNLESTQQRISFIENMILTKARPSHSLVLWSVRQLKQYGGVVSIPQLAAQAGVSQKKLERAFQKAVGVSPKSLARIFQFMKSKELLAHPQAHDLLSVALACGYYDHAHFTKSFKRYTGINPDEFRKNRVVSFLQTQPFNMYYFCGEL